jgi:hypothetical protein
MHYSVQPTLVQMAIPGGRAKAEGGEAEYAIALSGAAWYACHKGPPQG